MHQKLRVLDGVEVTEDERAAAADFIHSLPDAAQARVAAAATWSPADSIGADVDDVRSAFEAKADAKRAAECAGRPGVEEFLLTLETQASRGLVPSLESAVTVRTGALSTPCSHNTT